MKKLIILASAVAILAVYILVALGMSQADTFNPATYPRFYRSSASPNATPSNGSGVIWAPANGTYNGQVSALGNCEFYNSSTATKYYTVYDSATVAGQTTANAICYTACSSQSFCVCNASTSPVGPVVNGGLVAANGLSWGESATFPGPTGSPDVVSQAVCTFIVR